MKRILIALLLLIVAFNSAFAQGPKWVPNAKKAVVSVVTFDKEDKLLKTSNGFFISDKGVGVSDFDLFKGAHRAIVIDADGNEHPVASILGADDTYDVVKFRIEMNKIKKTPFLNALSTPLNTGGEVYVLPYSVKKDRVCYPGKISQIDSIRGSHLYYTIDMRMTENLVSCPVVNVNGDVVGLIQRNFDEKAQMVSHAIDINFIKSLKVGALSFSDLSLKDIHIKKGLPEDQDEALVYLFVSESSVTPEQFGILIQDYIAQFPDSSEGYLRLAQYLLDRVKTEADVNEVQKNLDTAYRLSEDKSEALFSTVKIICSNQNNDLLKDQKDWTLDEALTKINKAIEMNAQPVYTQVKAEILTSLDRLDEALACYEEVNQSDIASPLSFFNTALVQRQKGAEPEVVLALLDSCVNRLEKPYNFDAAPFLLERALHLTSMDKKRDALKDFNEYYYAVNGQVNSNFFYIRGQVSLEARLYQQALDDIDMALQMEPKNIMYMLHKASVNLRVARYDVALSVLNDVLVLEPDNGEAYRLQGVAYIQLKDKVKACVSLNKAKELGDPLVDDLIKENCK